MVLLQIYCHICSPKKRATHQRCCPRASVGCGGRVGDPTLGRMSNSWSFSLGLDRILRSKPAFLPVVAQVPEPADEEIEGGLTIVDALIEDRVEDEARIGEATGVVGVVTVEFECMEQDEIDGGARGGGRPMDPVGDGVVPSTMVAADVDAEVMDVRDAEYP